MDDLLPLTDKGDIVVDGGNDWWGETGKRQLKASGKGVELAGMGVSGGCEYTSNMTTRRLICLQTSLYDIDHPCPPEVPKQHTIILSHI